MISASLYASEASRVSNSMPCSLLVHWDPGKDSMRPARKRWSDDDDDEEDGALPLMSL